MANSYTENGYNSYLLIIRSPQLNIGESLFLTGVQYVWVLYKVYKTIPVFQNSLRRIKQRRKTQVRQVFYSSLPLSQIF